jgi:hypothetical protein
LNASGGCRSKDAESNPAERQQLAGDNNKSAISITSTATLRDSRMTAQAAKFPHRLQSLEKRKGQSVRHV